MAKVRLVCLLAAALAGSLGAETLTRTATVTSENPAAVFAVPNGCTFTGATASEGHVTLGEPTTMNGVVLQPVAAAEYGGGILASATCTLTAAFESGATPWTGIPSKVIRRQIKSRVANPDDVSLVAYTAPGVRRAAMALPTADSNSGIDMLIISPPALTNQWEGYATLRMAQLNARETAAEDQLNIKVVNTFEIYDKYPYPNWATANNLTADGDCRNPAESIHKYLRENALAMGVSYVYLGGTWIDAQSLNEQDCWVYGSSVVTIKTDADGNTEPLSVTNAVPGVIVTPRESLASDAFYACLDLGPGQKYPWSYYDASNDVQETRYFYVQNNDLTRAPYYDAGPDLIVSRMTFKPFTINGKFYGVQDIFDAYTNKLARSEGDDYKGTGFYGLFYHSQNYVTYNADGSLPYDYEFFDDTPNLFADYRTNKSYFGNETSCRPMMRDHIAKYRPIRGVDVINAKAWTSGYATMEAARDAAYAKDRDYQGALAHGWRGGNEGNQWNDAFLSATGLVLLNDDSLPCDTGMLNDGANLCLGESAVEGPTGGAIASINNTHYGWSGGPDDLSLKMWHLMERGFLQYNYNVGESWLDTHLNYLGLTTTNGTFYATNLGGTGFWVFLEHSIFGDPLARAKIPHAVGTPTAATEFPDFASNVVCAAECTVTGTNAVLTAGVAGDLTLKPADDAPVARFKVMNSLLSGGSTITFADGLEGGVGKLVGFTNAAPGRVVVETTKRLYLGGFTNVGEIVVHGANAILDVDTIDTALTNIVFDVATGSTNIIRGIKTGQLAHTVIHSTGGVIKLETSDIFGGTSVELEGTTVTLGPNPKQGSLVASSEPMNAVFSGSGKIEYPYGTRLLRNYTIADGSSVSDTAVGTLQVGFRVNGTLGSSPNGWFTSWSGETFDSNYGYLSPGGFVGAVSSGHHPWYALPAKRGFTVGFYADLSMMTNAGNRVLLNFGSANGSGNSIILLCGEDKTIDLVVTKAYGISRANTDFTPFAYPGDGFHLYIVEFQGNQVSLQIDGDSANKQTSTLDAIALDAGLQVGAQYAGRKNGWVIATDMLFGAMVGYDAILTEDETAALVANYPAQEMPWGVSSTLEYGTASGTGVMRDANFAPGCYLGISKGTIEVPSGTTISVPAISMNNTSDGGCEAYLNIRGTVYLNNAYDTDNNATDIYYLQKRSINNGETNKLVGVMMGHWAGKSTISVYAGGYLNATNTYILANYDATGDQLLDIVGGHVKTRGIINYSKDAYNGTHKTGDHGAVMIREDGILEVASWPTKSLAELGTLPITLSNGTLRAYADWTCPRPLTFAGETNTFDCAGADIVFSGEVEGSGVLKLMDSVGGGSITFLGTHTNITEGAGTTICFDASLETFGCRAGCESEYSPYFTTSNKPKNLRVILSAEQIVAYNYTSPFTTGDGTTIIFTDESGTVYQSAKRSDYAPEDVTWGQSAIVKDGFTYAVTYHGDDGQWDTLANWCDVWTNSLGNATNYTAKYTDGIAPMKTSSSRYIATLIDGPYDVYVDQLEGWNTRLGIYGGAHVTVDKWVKFQKESTSSSSWWGTTYTSTYYAFVRVGEGSQLKINGSPNGGYSDVIQFEIASPSGLVFTAVVAGKPGNATYYGLGEKGSVVYEKGVTVGTHQITNCVIRLSDSSLTGRRIVRRELINFGGVGCTNSLTLASSAITMLNKDGTTYAGTKTSAASEYAAITGGIGNYVIEQNHEGIYIAYVDYSETDESKKILITGNYTGSTSSGILRNLDSSWTVTMTDATNYLDLVTSSPVLQPTIVMEDSAHGWPAFTFTDGYSKDMIGLRKVTGTGTISGSKVRPLVSQLLRLQDVTDYSGSLMLSNGATRILFDAGATITNISSQIQVASGSTAYLKDGGFWAATNGIDIVGTLAPKGTATIYDNTKGVVGAGNIKPAEGYAYHCVTTTAGSTTNQVWVVNASEPLEAARINALTSSQTLRVNGSLLVSGTVGTASKLTAVATTAGTDATTYYGTFEDALTAAGETTPITLRQNVSYTLTKGITFKIQKSSYTLTPVDTENKYLVQTSEADGVITYSADLASTKHNITYAVDGVTVSFEPATFIERGLPVALPVTNEVEKVFDGWYTNADYTAEKTAVIPQGAAADVAYYARMLPAVALVSGVYYADFASAIAAASVYGNTIYIVGNPTLPAEYMNIDGRLVHAAASMGGTLYSSFSAATNAANGATIKLLADVSAMITLTSEQVLKLELNNHTISVYVASDCRLLTESVDGVTTYTARPCTYTGTLADESVSWSPALPTSFLASDKLVYTGAGTAALPEGYTNCLSVTVGEGATVTGATTAYTAFAGTGTIVYTDQTTIPYYNAVKTYTVGVSGTITAGDVQIAGGSEESYTKHAFVDGLSITTTNRFLTGNSNPSRNRIDLYAGSSVISTGTGADNATQTCPMILAHWSNSVVDYTLHGGTLALRPSDGSAKRVMFGRDGSIYLTVGTGEDEALFEAPGIWAAERSNASALVIGTNGTVRVGSAGLDLNAAKPVTLQGGTLANSAANSVSASTEITLASNTVSTICANYAMTVKGPVAGTGDLVKTGAGVLSFTGSLTNCTGTVTLEAGAISVSGTSGFGGSVVAPAGYTLLDDYDSETGSNVYRLTEPQEARDTISLNFTSGNAKGTLPDTMYAGVYPVIGANWNQCASHDGSGMPEIDIPLLEVRSTGVTDSTTVSAAILARNTWNAASRSTPATGDGHLLYGYLDDGTAASVTISNIPYTVYTAYVYFGSDQADTATNCFKPFQVNGSWCPDEGVTWGAAASTHESATSLASLAADKNYCTVTGLNTGVLAIKGQANSAGSGSRTSIAAVQIVNMGVRAVARCAGVNYATVQEAIDAAGEDVTGVTILDATAAIPYGYVTVTTEGVTTLDYLQKEEVEAISINFTAGLANGTLPDNLFAGVIPVKGADWIQYEGPVTNTEQAVISASNTWNAKNLSTPRTGNGYLLYGYLDDGGSGASVVVSNIPYASYTTYVYFGTDKPSVSFKAFQVNDVWYPGEDETWGDADYTHETAAKSIALTERGNYFAIKNGNTTTLRIKGPSDDGYGTSRCTIAAVQIVNTGARVGQHIYWAASNSGDWSGEDSNGTHTFYTEDGAVTSYVQGDTLVITNVVQFWSKTAAQGAKYQIGTVENPTRVYFTRSGDHSNDYVLSNSTVTVASGSILSFRRYGGTNEDGGTGWDSYNSKSPTMVTRTTISGEGAVLVDRDVRLVLSEATTIANPIQMYAGATLVVPADCSVTVPTPYDTTGYAITGSTDDAGTITYTCRALVALAIPVPTGAALVSVTSENGYVTLIDGDYYAEVGVDVTATFAPTDGYTLTTTTASLTGVSAANCTVDTSTVVPNAKRVLTIEPRTEGDGFGPPYVLGPDGATLIPTVTNAYAVSFAAGTRDACPYRCAAITVYADRNDGAGWQLAVLTNADDALELPVGTAVYGIYGYGAALRADEVSDLEWSYPAVAQVEIAGNFNLNDATKTVHIHNAVATNFVGATNGKLVIPFGSTVETPHLRVLNSEYTANEVTLDIAGTLTVTSDSTVANVWSVRDELKGVLLGHWHGTGTYNITGTLAATNVYIETVFTAEAQSFNVTGGRVATRGFYANNAMSTITLSENGTIDVWDALIASGSKAIVQNYGRGMIRFRSTKDYTLTQTMTFTDADYGTEFDLGGNTVTASAGIFGGTGKFRIVNGTLVVPAGSESNVVVTSGATLKLTATEAQIDDGYTAAGITIVEGGTVEFWNESLTEQQNSEGNRLIPRKAVGAVDFITLPGILTAEAQVFASDTSLAALTNTFEISGLCCGSSVNNKIPLMALVTIDPNVENTSTNLTLQFRVKHDRYAKAVRVIFTEEVNDAGTTNVMIKVGNTAYHDWNNGNVTNGIDYAFTESDFTGTAVTTWNGNGYGVTDVVALRRSKVGTCVAGYAGTVYATLAEAYAVATTNTITLFAAADITLAAGDICNVSRRGFTVTATSGVDDAVVCERYHPAEAFRTLYYLNMEDKLGVYCHSCDPLVYVREYLGAQGLSALPDTPLEGETVTFDPAHMENGATSASFTDSTLAAHPIFIAAGMTVEYGGSANCNLTVTGEDAATSVLQVKPVKSFGFQNATTFTNLTIETVAYNGNNIWFEGAKQLIAGENLIVNTPITFNSANTVFTVNTLSGSGAISRYGTNGTLMICSNSVYTGSISVPLVLAHDVSLTLNSAHSDVTTDTMDDYAVTCTTNTTTGTYTYTSEKQNTLSPVTPGVEVLCADAAAATNAMNLINTAKTTYIALPTNTIDAVAYCNLFVAEVKGTAIIVNLTYDATTNLQAQVNADVALAEVRDATADEVTITTTPGLYYTILGGTEVRTITTPGESVLATKDTTELPKPELGTTTKAFYKVRVSVRKEE